MRILDAVYVYRLVGGDKLAWHGRYHAHGPGEYEFHCFLEGHGSFLNNRAKSGLEPGRLFLTRPREFHSILPEAVARPITYYAFLFRAEPEPAEAAAADSGALARLEAAAGGSGRPRTVEPRDRFLVEETFNLARSGDAERQRSAGYLLLSLIHRWYGAETPAAAPGAATAGPIRSQHVERGLEMMRRRIREKLGPAELAEELGVSEEHFIRLFRAELGMAPFQYFTRLKAEAASAFLAEGKLPVAAVAEYFGYENPFHFSRVFKKCTGLAPLEYRRTYARAGGAAGEAT